MDWCGHSGATGARAAAASCRNSAMVGAAGASTRFNSSLPPSLFISLSLSLPNPSAPPHPLHSICTQTIGQNVETLHNSEHLFRLCQCLRFDFPILFDYRPSEPPLICASLQAGEHHPLGEEPGSSRTFFAGLCTLRSWSKWILLPSPGGRDAIPGAGALLTLSWMVSQFFKVPRRLLPPTGELGSVFSSCPCSHKVLPL